MHRYFAYGSNMNPERVRQRGLQIQHVERATLAGYRLSFDKHAADHAGAGHACLCWQPDGVVEGVLYWLVDAEQINRMDVFERTPINYSRDIVEVETTAGPLASWTYFANPAVLRPGLRPPRAYLAHLLAGRSYLSPGYFERLSGWPCAEDDG
jgi:cation transport regulator ChaC